jgi:hypothetical protein
MSVVYDGQKFAVVFHDDSEDIVEVKNILLTLSSGEPLYNMPINYICVNNQCAYHAEKVKPRSVKQYARKDLHVVYSLFVKNFPYFPRTIYRKFLNDTFASETRYEIENLSVTEPTSYQLTWINDDGILTVNEAVSTPTLPEDAYIIKDEKIYHLVHPRTICKIDNKYVNLLMGPHKIQPESYKGWIIYPDGKAYVVTTNNPDDVLPKGDNQIKAIVLKDGEISVVEKEEITNERIIGFISPDACLALNEKQIIIPDNLYGWTPRLFDVKKEPLAYALSKEDVFTITEDQIIVRKIMYNSYYKKKRMWGSECVRTMMVTNEYGDREEECTKWREYTWTKPGEKIKETPALIKLGLYYGKDRRWAEFEPEKPIVINVPITLVEEISYMYAEMYEDQTIINDDDFQYITFTKKEIDVFVYYLDIVDLLKKGICA